MTKPPGTSDELVAFTNDERDAVERHLKMCMSMMDDSKPSPDGRWMVQHRFKAGLVAQGLWFYADQLVSASLRLEAYNASDPEIGRLLRKAMTARVKAVKIFPLPIGFYHVAVLAAALDEPDAAAMFSGFVDEQRSFHPDAIEAQLIKTMRWDIPGAVSDSKKRLGLR